MMNNPNSSFIDLNKLLQRVPIAGDIHPLVPICLSPETHIFDEPRLLLDIIDDQAQGFDQPILLLKSNSQLSARFNTTRILDHPPVDIINKNLRHRLDYIRQSLLTTHKLAAHIESDVGHYQYDLVVFLLIDGLSYGDVLGWGFDVTPCFVDGPSVTFQTDDAGKLISSIGFASIVGDPPVAQRLYHLGYHSAFGYTYWQARDNLLAGYMFKGIPDNAVVNFEDILGMIEEEEIPAKSYIQIVREGLDGLAHSKRELRTNEIQSAIQAVKDDIERLIASIQSKSLPAVIFITSDHGILWKNDHDWKMIDQNGSKPRYSISSPDSEMAKHYVRFECNHRPYYLYTYPYLGKPIRKNDSGVHGGLSYQESLVPFMKIKV